MPTDLGIFVEPLTPQIRQTLDMTCHNQSLYQKLLLVNHIPAIEGIAGVQDLIKAFAYRGDLYMEKAKQFGERCKKVLYEINGIQLVTADCIWTNISKKYLYDRLSIFNSRFCSFCGDYHTLQYFRKHKRNTYPKCKCL